MAPTYVGSCRTKLHTTPAHRAWWRSQGGRDGGRHLQRRYPPSDSRPIKSLRTGATRKPPESGSRTKAHLYVTLRPGHKQDRGCPGRNSGDRGHACLLFRRRSHHPRAQSQEDLRRLEHLDIRRMRQRAEELRRPQQAGRIGARRPRQAPQEQRVQGLRDTANQPCSTYCEPARSPDDSSVPAYAPCGNQQPYGPDAHFAYPSIPALPPAAARSLQLAYWLTEELFEAVRSQHKLPLRVRPIDHLRRHVCPAWTPVKSQPSCGGTVTSRASPCRR